MYVLKCICATGEQVSVEKNLRYYTSLNTAAKQWQCNTVASGGLCKPCDITNDITNKWPSESILHYEKVHNTLLQSLRYIQPTC
jgi:hypothetical protein